MPNENTNTIAPPTTQTLRRAYWSKLALAAVVFSLIVFSAAQLSTVINLENLIRHESKLRELLHRYPFFVFGGAFLIYVTIIGLSLPVASLMTAVYGWYFGFARGVILVSFASTTGATLAFLLSRFLFREAFEKQLGDRAQRFNASLKSEGPFFLFGLRMMPMMPFFIVNTGMGLTPIRVWTFWWVSQLGMLPGTIVYTYVGSSIPSLQVFADQGIGAVFTPQQLALILGSLVSMGSIALIFHSLTKRRQRFIKSSADVDHGDVDRESDS